MRITVSAGFPIRMRGSKPILRSGRDSPDIARGFQFDSDLKSAIIAIRQRVQPFHPRARGGERRTFVRMIHFQNHDIAAHDLMPGAVFAAVIADRERRHLFLAIH